MLVTLLSFLYYILQIYFYILIGYVLLSWVPELRESKFYYYLHLIANPYMRLFRGFLVFGGMDFTPILGFLLYNFGLMAFGQFIQSL